MKLYNPAFNLNKSICRKFQDFTISKCIVIVNKVVFQIFSMRLNNGKRKCQKEIRERRIA